MLSLLKKPGADKSAESAALPWRPDFRDVSSLPDTKVVRTDFVVNLVALVITGGLALFVAQREWAVVSLRNMLAEVEARIADAAPDSEKAVAAYKLFQAEETKFNEAFALVREPFRFQHFLAHLGSVLPANVRIGRVDYRGLGQTVVVHGSVKGLDAAASDAASNFVEQLQQDAEFARYFPSITLTSLGRNADEGSLNLELVFAFPKPEVKKGPVKK
jgi:hypothetical protein